MSDKALYHISNALVISAIIKLFIIAYSVMFSVPIIQAVKSYGAFFETSLMTYAVEDSVIGRIQFTSDSAIPFILFYFILLIPFLKEKIKNFRMLKSLS
ncbi:hypothetical protein [Klebsiella quasipneumoniae]|uniref:hypothetical protein n=1 Tax=Klebsiella quasipneumoniae TaxID=1463165 RepID=UPI0015D4836D|nr:hypothetical protein [Klebsiella quasipneumoniae]